MPDTPFPSQTPGQLLAGSPQQPPQQVGQPPLADRLAPSAQPSPPPQAPPTPQQAVAAKHQALGKVTSFLFGQQHDESGQPVKQHPGQLFRSLLAGALLGMAAGAQSPARGGTVGSMLGGVGAGYVAVSQQQL